MPLFHDPLPLFCFCLTFLSGIVTLYGFSSRHLGQLTRCCFVVKLIADVPHSASPSCLWWVKFFIFYLFRLLIRTKTALTTTTFSKIEICLQSNFFNLFILHFLFPSCIFLLIRKPLHLIWLIFKILS